MEILKIKMKYILSLSLTLFVLGSCKKKATIELPKAENKLVVTCFLSPGDSLITAVVQTSKPKFYTSNFGQVNVESAVEDAKVVLSDGSNEISLTFNPDGYYRASSSTFPIIGGKTYYLNVSAPDGRKADAKTTIVGNPLNVSMLEVKVRDEGKKHSEFFYDVNMTIDDEPGVLNYVEVYFETATAYVPPKQGQNPFPIPIEHDTLFGRWMSPYFETDEKTSKEKYQVSRPDQIYAYDTITYSRLDIAVLNCNRDFYLYNESVEKARYNTGDPFANPVQVYTNINNGFGCFGSFAKTFIRRKLF